jgi:elongation factor P
MKDGMTLDRTSYQGETIGVELPVTVDLKVVETEPGFAGDTQSGARKPATTESGLIVQVPIFVEPGDTIRVDTPPPKPIRLICVHRSRRRHRRWS